MAALVGTGTVPLVLRSGWTVWGVSSGLSQPQVWEMHRNWSRLGWCLSRDQDLGKIDPRNIFFHDKVKVAVSSSSSLWCLATIAVLCAPTTQDQGAGGLHCSFTRVTCLQLSLEMLESKSPSQVFPGAIRWWVVTAKAEKRTGYSRQYLISASWDFSVVSILTYNVF